MREILFRGKRAEDNKWVYGYFEKYNGRTYINLQTERLNTGGYPIREFVEVIPETVGEYTGLCDKNGNKIFEGDIVKYGNTIHKAIFEQRNGTAYFGLVYSAIETLPFGHYQDLKQIEIIGNIHDNKNLLEEEQ